MGQTSKSGVELFPLGIATGAAFCNRGAERAQLKNNILTGTHTWLMGHRRYGKTSLVAQVGEELSRRRKPRVHIGGVDLLVVHNLAALDAVFRAAVGNLSACLLPRNRRVLGHLQKLFAAFRPELVLRDDGFSIRLFSEKPSAQRIEQLLKALDTAAVHYGRRVVLVIDEFQQLARIDKGHAIEAAVRSVAQQTRGLAFVFLGSERTLLAEMFEQSARPLYHLCAKMELDRIVEADYRQFLNEAATLRWNRVLSKPAMSRLLGLTGRHPFYVNALCRGLWRERAAPSANKVEAAWLRLVEQERHRVSQRILELATAQRALLAALARQPTGSPTAQSYLASIGMASSTVIAALEVLEAKDLVRRGADQVYEIVDPLMLAFLQDH